MEIQDSGVFTEDPTPSVDERKEIVPGPDLAVTHNTPELPDSDIIGKIIHGVMEVPPLPRGVTKNTYEN